MEYIYHAVPNNFEGNELFPLFDLEKRAPERFAEQIKKYDDHPARKGLPHKVIPNFGCRRGDVLHCSPTHPSLIFQALKAIFPNGNRGMKFFKIPIDWVAKHEIYLFNPNHPIYRFGNKTDAEVAYSLTTRKTYREQRSVPVELFSFYQDWKNMGRKGAPPWAKIPHVFVKGPIPTTGLEIIDWREPLPENIPLYWAKGEEVTPPNPQAVIRELGEFDIDVLSHTGDGLVSHLLGTYYILRNWRCSAELCYAGLCHSVYGTESYNKQTVPLDRREKLRHMIGEEAEQLAYLFGAHKKESLWENLTKEQFYISDRFENTDINITKGTLADLITLTLANWLEQRPRAGKEHQFIRKDEFWASRTYLPEFAWREFIDAYGLPMEMSK